MSENFVFMRGKALHLFSDFIKKKGKNERKSHMYFKQVFVNTKNDLSKSVGS